MNVLLIKTSSLGDVIHTLPALTDAYQATQGSVRFDWVVEEAFAEIPAWHPAVARVVPVALRRWRKTPLQTLRSGEFKEFKAALRGQRYDCVIDAQGLLKSAWMTCLNAAPGYGYDAASIREPLASRFYDHRLAVSRQQHAVERTRQLFALSLGYGPATSVATSDTSRDTTATKLSASPPDYGLQLPATPLFSQPYVFLLHGTTWGTKHYPEQGWAQISQRLQQQGLTPVVTWGNEVEQQRAQRLATTGAHLLPKTSLRQLAAYLAGAAGAIAVDTGLGHLATALDVPLVGLYGPTNPALSGIYGARQFSLQANYHCAPCMRKTCRYECLGVAASCRFEAKSPALPVNFGVLKPSAGVGAEFEPPCWSGLEPDAVVQRLLSVVAS